MYQRLNRLEEQDYNYDLRLKGLFAIVFIALSIFVLRLFYLQVFKHQYYKGLANSSQQKQYNIQAKRGLIYGQDNGSLVPLVLNETKYRVVIDSTIIKDKDTTLKELSSAISGLDQQKTKDLLEKQTKYEIIANKQPQSVRDDLQKKELPGVFIEELNTRTYPQGKLASQTLGFVNDDQEGTYGVEQALDDALDGQEGRVKAITDRRGVPLLASGENVLIDPKNGEDIVLTIDLGMQRFLEDILEQGLNTAQSQSGSAIIMDPNTGAIKAIANYPSYDPSNFSEITDQSIFTNPAVSSPLEPGSIMKTLTVAAALDSGAVDMNHSYFDPGYAKIDDATITNVEEVGGSGTRSIQDILKMSLNTGAVHLLGQMGGGEINSKARNTWYDYMTNHYQLGKLTGVEQGYESEGILPDPNEGYGLNVQFANTSFGQGMTATPLQMLSALSSVVNGGTYYQPHLVDKRIDSDNKETPISPKIVKSDTVSEEVSGNLVRMMQYTASQNNKPATRSGYLVGGKTGTAQIANPAGGYYDDRFNGTYLGFVGGKKINYTIIVRVNEPKIRGYAGSKAAAPIFASIANMLMNNFTIDPM